MMQQLALLITSLLFGGMSLYSFGFAAFLFSALPAETANMALRRAFPHFYLFVFFCAVLASACWWLSDPVSGEIMAIVAITTFPARQQLMPAINHARDEGLKSRFKWLHGLSVIITLAHIVASAWVLLRMIHV